MLIDADAMPTASDTLLTTMQKTSSDSDLEGIKEALAKLEIERGEALTGVAKGSVKGGKTTKDKPTKDKPTKHKPTKHKPRKGKPTKHKPRKGKAADAGAEMRAEMRDIGAPSLEPGATAKNPTSRTWSWGRCVECEVDGDGNVDIGDKQFYCVACWASFEVWASFGW